MYAILVERFGAFTWDTSNPLTWVLALVLYDFFYYWVHRSGHEVNILWAAHVVHHSSEEFNMSTAMRQSSTGFYFRWVFYVPLALLGFPVKVFLTVAVIDLVYQFLGAHPADRAHGLFGAVFGHPIEPPGAPRPKRLLH
jgi:sterol desaturase/sphingolipid hydroxylase (fatty acid hydroxylase superfamily)